MKQQDIMKEQDITINDIAEALYQATLAGTCQWESNRGVITTASGRVQVMRSQDGWWILNVDGWPSHRGAKADALGHAVAQQIGRRILDALTKGKARTGTPGKSVERMAVMPGQRAPQGRLTLGIATHVALAGYAVEMVTERPGGWLVTEPCWLHGADLVHREGEHSAPCPTGMHYEIAGAHAWEIVDATLPDDQESGQ